jgi:alpha-L-fucosidase
MIHSRIALLWLVTAALGVVAQGQPARPHGAETEHERRMQWWRDARFGLFIHWGLYAVPAGEWKDDRHHGEWIMTTAQIPVEEYEKFRGRFNPVKFNADSWAQLAADAGMKYIVITSKHHDGFCLFDSQHTDYDILSTPFKRDIMRELADAARKRDLRICWYHSVMDWHHPDYLPRRDWEQRSSEGADFDRYRNHMKRQVRELLTNYGPIGVLWFDGEWESTWTHEHGLDLFRFCREISPDTLVNNRVDKGRTGMAGMTRAGGFAGDFGTPEQEIPPTGLPGVDWETCMTMNDHWGYNAADLNYKSSAQIIRTLVDVVSKGGNFLLNVGPTAEGEFPPESVTRLKEIGAWMRVHGKAIHGAVAGPFRDLPWGRCTRKPLESGDTRLFLHIFDWPADGRLAVPGLVNEPLLCQPLSEMGRPAARFVGVKRDGDALVLSLEDHDPFPPVTVIALDVRGEPWVIPPPSISPPDDVFVDSLDVSVALDASVATPPGGGAAAEFDLRYTIDGSDPGFASLPVTGPIRLRETITVSARAFREGKPFSPVARRRFTRVSPRPALQIAAESSLPNGLEYTCYEGDWQRLPDFDQLNPTLSGMVPSFSPPPGARREHYAVRYRGWIKAPAADVYRFYLTSDDGSRLYIGDELVADNDGLHAAEERTGRIALAAGLHPITLAFFQRTGDQTLRLEWSTLTRDREPVPAAALFRTQQKGP